ncbi:hypothetical protein A8950_2705 [Dongia mobilis]|uniref:Uncharacterized protein n=1 Tax=Dongia mobilis TaxID=578943 RepID=A0A4R6WKB1_9PROT|nr:hypothetical protein [Dongia mobilis]TDQ80837.1 hypothetical protein A8950_2705 [Dongia mobilis]
MRRLVLVIVLLAVAFLWAPQVLESASGACDALEQKMVAREAKGSQLGSDLGAALMQNLSGGAVAEAAMKDKHPNLPPLVSCALEYWKVTFGG